MLSELSTYFVLSTDCLVLSSTFSITILEMAAEASSNSSEAPKLFWTGIVMTVTGVRSNFFNKQIVKSEKFACPQDSEKMLFESKLKFGDSAEGLEASANCTTGKVTIRSFKVVILDINGNVLAEKFSPPDFSKNYRKNAIYYIFFKDVSNPAPENTTWRILFEVAYSYGGSSSAKPLFLAGDISALSKDYLQLLETSNNADFTFIVRGQTLKAHKAILAARSTYFANMFRADMKENLTNKVEVPDANPDAFRGMLQYIYGGVPPASIRAICMDLFAIADKYGFDDLKDICEFHICRKLNATTVVDALLLAERYNRVALMSHAKLALKAYIHAVERSQENREKFKNEPEFFFKLLVDFVKQWRSRLSSKRISGY